MQLSHGSNAQPSIVQTQKMGQKRFIERANDRVLIPSRLVVLCVLTSVCVCMMAYVNMTSSVEAGPESKKGLFASLMQTWADYRLYRRTIAELRRLSDRELADLGIARSSIYHTAKSAVYTK